MIKLRGSHINSRRLAPAGYVSITKPYARLLYESGKEITIAGNNVNRFHIIEGWHLGYSTTMEEQEQRHFEDVCRYFLHYLDRELGSYAVYYAKQEDIKA